VTAAIDDIRSKTSVAGSIRIHDSSSVIIIIIIQSFL